MGIGDKCCVGGCDHDQRYPEKFVVHSHVETFRFHKPYKADSVEKWCVQVQKGRKDLKFGTSLESVVCSNHFKDSKPTRDNPFLTVFLTPFDHAKCKSPRKRRRRLEYGRA